MGMKYAGIDIGSNSVRLMLSDGAITLGKRLESTRLSEGLSLSGALSADAIERTARAVANFVSEAKAEKCDVVYAFATEAVRSASNGAEFVARCARDGVKVDVLPGGDEAKLGFWGAYSGGRQAVLDIGGGAAEMAGRGGGGAE